MYWLRVGSMGRLSLARAAEAFRLARGARVIVRTERGLERGEVLAAVAAMDDAPAWDSPIDLIVRPMAVEDELLAARLEQHRSQAIGACEALLAKNGLGLTLLEVEQSFDGQTLFFHFLGGAQSSADEVLEELAAAYADGVRLESFVTALSEGCGPGCGTEDAPGGGCTACEVGCAVQRACGTRRAGHDRETYSAESD